MLSCCRFAILHDVRFTNGKKEDGVEIIELPAGQLDERDRHIAALETNSKGLDTTLIHIFCAMRKTEYRRRQKGL